MSKGSTPRPLAVSRGTFEDRWAKAFGGERQAPRVLERWVTETAPDADGLRLIQRRESVDRWGVSVDSRLFEIADRG